MKLFQILTAIVAMLATAPAHADTLTWDGQFNEFWDHQAGSNTNWSPENNIPDANDIVVFSLSSPNTTVDLNGSRSVLSATFGGTVDYTLTFGAFTDTLTLVSGDITATGSATHEIATGVVLGDTGDWSISNTLFQVTGRISGGFDLDKTGTGTLSLQGDNTYTGETIVAAGTLIVTGADERIADTSALQIETGAEFRVDGITETIEGIKFSNGSLFLDNGATLQLSPTIANAFITGPSPATMTPHSPRSGVVSRPSPRPIRTSSAPC